MFHIPAKSQHKKLVFMRFPWIVDIDVDRIVNTKSLYD